MVKQSVNKPVGKLQNPRPRASEFAPSNRTSKLTKNSVDDVIVSLSDSYENQRARQVVEWVRNQSVRRAS